MMPRRMPPEITKSVKQADGSRKAKARIVLLG